MNKERIKKGGPLLAVGGTLAAVVVACGGRGNNEQVTPTPLPDTPVPTRTVKPSIELTSTPAETIVPTETPTVETIAEKAIFTYSNWQIGINSWDERPSKEGWKTIDIGITARNISEGFLPGFFPGPLEELLGDLEIEAEGYTFDASLEVETANYNTNEDGTVLRLDSFGNNEGYCEIPPGYSIPMRITINIPQIYNDYSLGSKLLPAVVVKRGEIVENFPRIIPIYDGLLGVNEAWELPSASVRFNEILTESFETGWGSAERQVVSLDFQNKLGDRDLNIYESFVCIIHKDGRKIVHGSRLFTHSDSNKTFGGVPVGTSKTAYLEIGGYAYDGEIFDTQGATIVIGVQFAHNRQENNIATWKLP